MPTCNFFWGSHGCDLPDDGHRVHQCGLAPTAAEEALVALGELHPDAAGECCQYDEDRPAEARVRWWYSDGSVGPWHEYGEGWRQ